MMVRKLKKEFEDETNLPADDFINIYTEWLEHYIEVMDLNHAEEMQCCVDNKG